MRWLVVALLASALTVVFRRAFAWRGMRHDKLILKIDPRDPKTAADYADVYLVLGLVGTVISAMLIALKFLLG